MGTGAITPYVDVAQLVLYVFWIFFAGLIYYLVRENHREGYPMDHDGNGTITGWPVPQPKTYLREDGSTFEAPNDRVSPQTLNAQPAHRFAGAPLEPVGNPLLAGVGPGAWADRADHEELDEHGAPKIRPLRALPAFGVSSKDPDPRGQALTGADREVAGTVTDLWVDTAEMMFRYLELQVAGSGRKVLVPMNFARISRDGSAHVHALYSHQFGDVPATKTPDTVTILEEEKIQAYFGAGLLYADESRAEPLV